MTQKKSSSRLTVGPFNFLSTTPLLLLSLTEKNFLLKVGSTLGKGVVADEAAWSWIHTSQHHFSLSNNVTPNFPIEICQCIIYSCWIKETCWSSEICARTGPAWPELFQNFKDTRGSRSLILLLLLLHKNKTRENISIFSLHFYKYMEIISSTLGEIWTLDPPPPFFC